MGLEGRDAIISPGGRGGGVVGVSRIGGLTRFWM